jgi:hypothetical protein
MKQYLLEHLTVGGDVETAAGSSRHRRSASSADMVHEKHVRPGDAVRQPMEGRWSHVDGSKMQKTHPNISRLARFKLRNEREFQIHGGQLNGN